MKYRKFGKLDWEVSALGFGAMRLPVLDGDMTKINEPEATRMIRHAIDQGMNYVDTAYPYHGQQSEIFLGKVLQDGYREKVRLATKMPSYLIKETGDFERLFTEQLQKLQTERVDFYLLHALDKKRWETYKKLDIIKWAEQKKSEGKIGCFGFSFHDKFEVFKDIIDFYEGWDICQIQYNYMDVENQAGMKGLKYAASKGLGVVIMEPLLGGRLVDPPQPVQELWEKAPLKRKPADWALQWLWDQPEVSLVLSGMNTMQQVKENLASADHSVIGTMTPQEQEIIAQVRSKYVELSPIPCTRCEYCLPCPNDLNIPQIFGFFNAGKMYDKLDSVREVYSRFVPEGKRAEDCVACRSCEEMCPQQILISEWMPKVHEVLTLGKPYEEILPRF